jgi:hypothetical protein
MGVQLHVKVNEVLRAGCAVDVRHHPVWDDDEQLIGVFESATVTTPSGVVLGFHKNVDDLWIDVNPWGENRARYIPTMEELGVRYSEY